MKERRSLLLLFFLALSNLLLAQQTGASLKLWYVQPAVFWEEALPLGNAKTGAMVFGGVSKERFQLNDNTLWSGFPDAGNNYDGPQLLPLVRRQIDAGDYDSAAALWKKMQGPYSARYLPMADLWLDFGSVQNVTDYYRDLNLATAISTISYVVGGVHYKRESLISHVDKGLLIRITADRKAAVSFTATLTSKLRYRTKPVSGNELMLTGKAPKYVANRAYEKEQIIYEDKAGMNFTVRVMVRAEGGRTAYSDTALTVTGADAVTIYLTEATSFNGFNRSPALNGSDPEAEAQSVMNRLSTQPYDAVKQKHIKDYMSLFNRVSFSLPRPDQYDKQPTDIRLKAFAANKNDYGLQALYYQYGRYLMIASSRPGSRPANLQGLWNDLVQPPWGSNYTMNINTEMNYWPAENTALSECHQPLFDFIKELSVNGTQTAAINYGIKEGWVAHHTSDLWAKTSPPGGYDQDPGGMPRWSCWPMAGAWLSTHLWEHYLFTGDKFFLREKAYPLMKGAALFMLRWLVADSASGFFVTNPSTSPENTVKISGKEYQLTKASTMDMSILRELFTDLIKAAGELKVDKAFSDELTAVKKQLYPFHIGQYGQLQEWFKDWDDPADKHRHISHLFGLYPGSQLSIYRTPELAAAAKQSLMQRGDVSTGWSMAWKTAWWARLHDGEHAYKILSDAFTFIDPAVEKEQLSGGGTYPNLFDAHPPFQIDGNFGAVAGITEMLLQSHDGFIELLPALPAAWDNGSITGIKARGAFTIDIHWKDGRLTGSKIYAALGGNCRLYTPQPVRIIEVPSKPAAGPNANTLTAAYGQPPYQKAGRAKLVEIRSAEGYVIDFKTEKGKTYTVVPLKK